MTKSSLNLPAFVLLYIYIYIFQIHSDFRLELFCEPHVKYIYVSHASRASVFFSNPVDNKTFQCLILLL